MVLTYDTETTTNPNRRPTVYLAGYGDANGFSHFRNLSDCIDSLFLNHSGEIVYCYNLKFEWSFLLPLVSEKEWEYEELTVGLYHKMFSVKVTQKGEKGRGKKKRTIEFREASCLFETSPQGLKKIFKGWLGREPMEEVEYYENVPSTISPEFLEYFRRDICWLAEAVDKRTELFAPSKHTPLTIGADAFAWLKEIQPKLQFKAPKISSKIWQNLRPYYSGGLVLVNEQLKNKKIKINVYDRNSMYPSVMKECTLPTGNPIYIDKIPTNAFKGVWMGKFHFSYVAAKENVIPWLADGSTNSRGAKAYIDFGEEITCHLTHVEYEALKKDYDFKIEKIEEIIAFEGEKGLLAPYVEHFAAMKEKAGREGNKSKREFAKAMLNVPSGKFAQNPKTIKGHSYLDEKEILRWHEEIEEKEQTYYLPISIFITAYARCNLLDTCREIGWENVAYTDTDSVHTIKGQPKNLDSERLGAWNCEKENYTAKYLERKRYALESPEGDKTYKTTGINSKFYPPSFSLDNFRLGEYITTQKMVLVAGGSVMKERLVKI